MFDVNAVVPPNGVASARIRCWIRAEALLGQYFDPSAEELLQILLKSDHVQQRPASLDLHEEIDVAVGSILAAGD